jgi:four helix bundle protein
MKLEEFRVYQLSMDLGEQVWNIVIEWDYFAKDTIGKQLVRSIDSVAANLSEGYGRYHFKEAKNFSYYSRGSLYESKTWLTKARNRNLMHEEVFMKMMHAIDDIGVKLNNYIKSIGKTNTSQPHDQ